MRTADARRTLAFANTRDEAEKQREEFEPLTEIARHEQQPSDPPSATQLVERDGKWIIRNADGTADLASFDSEADRQAVLDRYAGIYNESAARRRNAWLALMATTPARDPASDWLATWAKAGADTGAALDNPGLFPDAFRKDARLRAATCLP